MDETQNSASASVELLGKTAPEPAAAPAENAENSRRESVPPSDENANSSASAENGEGMDGKKREEGAKEPESGKAQATEKEIAQAWENLGKNSDLKINEEIMSSFVKSAKEMGLDVEKAQKLVDWQIDWFKKANAELIQKSTESLKKDWGAEFEPRLNKSLEFVALLNSKFPNNEFAESIKHYGIANDATFIKAMNIIAEHIGEDSLARGSGALSSKEDDALAGIRNSMNEHGIKF